MKAKALIVLFLLAASLFGAEAFAACGTATFSGCETETFSACLPVKPTYTRCTPITKSSICNNYAVNFLPSISPLTCRECTWYTTTPQCKTVTPRLCKSTGSATVSCSAVPEFFGIEFGEMQFSTGIIALIAAIALPMVLFRKRR